MYGVINKYFAIISFISVFLLFSSCVSDIEDTTGTTTKADGKVQIALQLPISAEDAASLDTEVLSESIIKNLTLFLFDSQTGEKEFSTQIDILPAVGASSDVDMSNWLNEQIITILDGGVLADLDKARNIHIVANYTSDLTYITTEAQLDTVITKTINQNISQPDSNNPLVMHGVATSHNFKESSRATVSLVRNVAKIKLTLTAKKFTFGGEEIYLVPDTSSMVFKVTNQADKSYLVSKELSPSTLNYFNGAESYVAADSRDGAESALFITHAYVNENLRRSYSYETDATTLILRVPYKRENGEINMNNYYKILVNSDNGYHIDRNTIYDITANIVSPGGETDASAVLIKGTLNILPWNENTITSDLSQTFLSVQETITKIGSVKDFTFTTNALSTECSLTSESSWLTASFLSANQIRIKAASDDYTAPRIGILKLKVKNLIKMITVNQAPYPVQDGSISLTPRAIYLSETYPTKSVALAVTPETSRWLQTNSTSAYATCSASSGTGNASLTFTAGTTYGNTYYKFANLSTMEYDSVKVCNLHLEVPASIEIGGQEATTDFSDLKALGGDAKWVVKSVSDSWMTVTNVNGVLRIKAEAGPDEQKRYGTIIIAHANDENYTKTIAVTQLDHIIITIPEFEFLVIKYDWTGTNGKDLDTATEFMNTGLTNVDSRPLGYGLYGRTVWQGSGTIEKVGNSGTTATSGDGGQITDPSGNKLLVWGGDNTNQNAGESLYIDVVNLNSTNNYAILPRYIYIDLYAIWWSNKSSTPIKILIEAYKGGIMNRYPDTGTSSSLVKNFYNTGGATVYSNSASPATRVILRNQTGVFNSYRTSFDKVGRITFDKIKRSASIEIYTTSSTASSASLRSAVISDMPVQKQGESKDDYSKRVESYYKNKSK